MIYVILKQMDMSIYIILNSYYYSTIYVSVKFLFSLRNREFSI